MKTNLKGKLTIGRRSSTNGGDVVAIEIEDSASGTHVINLTVGLQEFASALMNLSYQDCDITLLNERLAGMRRETKTEKVPYRFYIDREQKSSEALAPFEHDGWKGNTDDLTNHHRGCKVGGVECQNVSFTRFVNPETGEPLL